MKPLAFLVLLSGLLATASFPLRAQVVASASGRQFTLTAGAFGSVFQPDYGGGGIAGTSTNRLYGVGTYVDIKFTRWIQIEGEARWLRFNQLDNINQTNYLIGPRLPIPHARFWRATPYAKALVGLADMNFDFNVITGRFTALAYGGGVDWRLTRKISVRAIDFEYQQWPKWFANPYTGANQQLFPYGASAGIGYRIF
jgi:opacity protein-like surface antigen